MNTLENKQRFFALYWGQEVALYKKGNYNNKTGTKAIVNGSLIKSMSIQSHTKTVIVLELKPLSNYSDEDAIAVEKIWRQSDERVEEYFRNGFQKESQGDYKVVGRLLIKHWLEENKISFQNRIDYKTIQKITDYLRKRGYAVPFDGITVDEMIEYGWLKLKEPKESTNLNT